MNRSTLALVLLAGALSWPVVLFSNAHAGEGRGLLSVEATVSSSCDIGGGNSLKLGRGLLDFGRHRLSDALTGLAGFDLAQAVKGTMPLRCSDIGVMPKVSFDYGLHATGRQRNLEGPEGSLVPYDLLRGSNVNQGFWDDNAYPVSVVRGKSGNIPLYGYIPRLPANAKDGLYTDTVTLRVDF